MSLKHRRAKNFEGPDVTSIVITGLSILLVLGLASPPLSSAAGNAKGKIAFTRGSGTAQEIYVMNADGTAQTRVTNNAVADYFPVISPNGAKIAFESVRNGNSDIYVIDPDGGYFQRLQPGQLRCPRAISRRARLRSGDGHGDARSAHPVHLKIFVLRFDGTRRESGSVAAIPEGDEFNSRGRAQRDAHG